MIVTIDPHALDKACVAFSGTDLAEDCECFYPRTGPVDVQLETAIREVITAYLEHASE